VEVKKRSPAFFIQKNAKARMKNLANLETVSPVTPDTGSVEVKVRRRVKTAWDRLDSLFMLVAATVRDLLPNQTGFSLLHVALH
jgi:hypothetical protein